MITIRLAERGEAKSLTALCVRSKAHWGYDAEFMRLSTPAIIVREADIAAGRVLVGCVADGRVVGLVRVRRRGRTASLGLMFVDPPAIGTGTGRALFEAAVRLARTLGAGRMTILADPHAAPFYEHMGARFLRNAPSDAIPGRTLPFYEYDLTSGAAS
ncbi:MAG: GNAT family N-acetyltransferase [Proteobacteria bacterium]|nr:GNAT family N-acetyltransferase [Pseudomonadota bacterium]